LLEFWTQIAGARQLAAGVMSTRSTTPWFVGGRDPTSSSLVPTFPICVNVKVMISPDHALKEQAFVDDGAV
jgi:hypothetical protein